MGIKYILLKIDTNIAKLINPKFARYIYNGDPIYMHGKTLFD